MKENCYVSVTRYNVLKTTTRKPFSDKNNLLNKSHTVQQYVQSKSDNLLQTKTHKNKSNKQSFQGSSNLNLDWEVTFDNRDTAKNTISKIMSFKKFHNVGKAKTLSPIVNIESNFPKNINEFVASSSPVVNIRQLSCKCLTKHLKTCRVVVAELCHDKSGAIITKIDPEKCNLPEKQSVWNVASINDSNSSSKPDMIVDQNGGHCLRQRKHKINYAKLHQGSSFGNETLANNSSIYKKDTHKRKKKLDVYEFDSSSDENKTNGKYSSDESITFEREMKLELHEIEEKYENKFKKKKKVANSKVHTVRKKQMEDFRLFDAKPQNASRKNGNRNMLTRRKDVNANLKGKKEKELLKIKNNVDVNKIKIQPVNKIVTNKVPEYRVNIIENIILQNGTSAGNISEKQLLTENVENILNENKTFNMNHSQDLINTEEKFVNTNKRKRNPKHSESEETFNDENVFDAMSDHGSSSDSLDFDTVIANSTPLYTERPKRGSTPWRANLYIKRNPHFLQYKTSALPSYNQDMVIDSDDVEKVYSGNKTPNDTNRLKKDGQEIVIDRSFIGKVYSGSKTPIGDSRSKKNGEKMIIDSDSLEKTYSSDKTPNDANHFRKTRQSSMLSYINGKIGIDSPDVNKSSLFDVHELSPIKLSSASPRKKSKSPRSAAGKENKSPKNIYTTETVEKVKRQILGEKVDNSRNILNNSVKSLNTKRWSENDENTFFGFENLSDADEDENKYKKNEGKQVWLFGKPLRLEDYVKVVKASEHVINDHAHEQNNEVVDVNQEEDDPEEETHILDERNSNSPVNPENQSSPIGLFEDLLPLNRHVTPKSYEKKPGKRARKKSVNSDTDSEDNYKKKKKDKRTRKEEMEAKKWTKAFNTMCQEVDKYHLEIE